MQQAKLKGYFKRHAKMLWQVNGIRQQQRVIANMKSLKNSRQLDTFHSAIKPFLWLAHIFGLMPLSNFLSADPHSVTFQLRSPGMCFSAIFLLLGGTKTVRIAIKILQGGIDARTMPALVFFTSCVIICLHFINLSRKWSRLIRPWHRIDTMMLQPPYRPTKHSLRSKLLLTGLVLGSLAIIEHCLFYTNSYYNFRMKILICTPNNTEFVFSDYMAKEFADIFEMLPYNIIFICYAFFLNGTFFFISYFIDIFIILISIALSERFQQFANRIRELKDCHVPDSLWHQIRSHHILLCELMEMVDSNMSQIVLISTLNNIYFICNRILAIFVRLRYPINYAYFWFALLVLLARTCAVFMCASRIHDASLRPLKVLYMVPSAYWTEEVQRFRQQLISQFIGLSGLRLYYLTRQSFSGMIYALVYYEFMLLQLDAKNLSAPLQALCP